LPQWPAAVSSSILSFINTLVEIAASVVTGFQVFFLSSAIADLLEKKNKISNRRNSWVIVFTIFLFAFYSFTRYFH